MVPELNDNNIKNIVKKIEDNKEKILIRLSDIELGKDMIKKTGVNMNSYNHLFSLFNDPSFANILNCNFVDKNGYDIEIDQKKISIKGMSNLMNKKGESTNSFNLLHTYKKSSQTALFESLQQNESDYVLLVQTKSPYSVGITTYNLAKKNARLRGGCIQTNILNDDIIWIISNEMFKKDKIDNKLFENTILNLIKLTSGNWD